TSVLAVAAAAAAEELVNSDTQTTTTTNPQQGTTTTTGGASNQAIFNVSKTITDTVTRIVNERLDVRPVITVPQGTRITVIVNADMNIPSIRR
ncbi:MAG TPA: TrbI/VirB10 family protein, partial [Rickettsiales bacterium]|nr:TrbI/VirB10 family protein [Rickettsiales bacterium]